MIPQTEKLKFSGKSQKKSVEESISKKWDNK